MNFVWQVLNWLIEKNNYKSYLEIGSRQHVTLNKVICQKKVGVDPSFKTDFQMTSDRFFSQNTDVFDIIFIDGNHESKQVNQDILNSMNCLSKNGTIVLHDVNPREERLLQGSLCNDAWWAFANLRTERDDIFMCTLPFDYIGIIRHGTQIKFDGKLEKSWKYLDFNRKNLMNEIEWNEFIKLFD